MQKIPVDHCAKPEKRAVDCIFGRDCGQIGINENNGMGMFGKIKELF
jgi:hypothetical protein